MAKPMKPDRDTRPPVESEEKGAGRATPNKRLAGNATKKGKARRDRKRVTHSGSSSNATLNAFAVETPIKAETLLFPSDSAAAAAFGTFTISPGSENFINMWTQVQDNFTATDRYRVVGDTYSRRTANAMAISFVPYFGSLEANVENTFLNPIRVAALNLKQFIDTSFGTNTAYDPADLMAYLMAVYAVWTYAAEIKRDLRLAFTYTDKQFPQFYPMGLFALLGIGNAVHEYQQGEGYLWTTQQLRSLIDQLNRVLVMFNRLPMPPEMSIFGYNDDLFDALFADTEDVETAQTYIFQTEGRWIYSSTGSIRGSRLLYTPNVRGNSIEDKIRDLSEMVLELTALRTSDTAMLQNLFNAYGSKDTARIGLLDINNIDGLPIVYHPGILSMIENCNWGHTTAMDYSDPAAPNGSYVSDIEVDSNTSNLVGHVYAPSTSHGRQRWPNLPLQFHKPMAEVTNDDIGWALRMHPTFTALKKFTITNRSDEEVVVDNAMTCDGMVGFAIPADVRVASFANDGHFVIQQWVSRDGQGTTGGFYEAVFNDFRHCPIFIATGWDAANGVCTLRWYAAERDVEFSYRVGDLQLYWTYLTQAVYAGNIIREVQGTRKF